MAAPKPIIRFRPYQKAGFRHPSGLLAYLYRRQSGKSYGLGNIALDWMMEAVCDVIFASASLRLGQENIRKEAEVWRQVLADLRLAQKSLAERITTSADQKGAPDGLLDVDAIADLFEHQKLETKLWHDRTRFSRSMVVAPNPDTAVGWTGHVILDEVGRIPDFQDVYEAMEPIVSSNAGLRVRLATTPPPDDAHYSWELLAPPPDLEESGFPVNPEGNFYKSRAGILVHRVDAWDGYAAGVPLYDLETREALTPEEHRERATDRTAWDRNYALKFLRGGTAAISVNALLHAQTAGARAGCRAVKITDQLVAA